MTASHPAPSPFEPAFDFARLPATPRPLVPAPAAPECELCVTIPAYNEEADIEQTLGALVRQVDLAGRPLDPARYEILVLANNCTDRTGEIVRAFAARHPALNLHLIEIVLRPPHAHVGAARRLVMDEALRRLEGLGRARGVIAATDGDTRVRPNWVAANLAEFARGVDAVGGRILSSAEQIAALSDGTRRYYRLDTAYRTLRAAYETVLDPNPANPWPRHHHCFGASLAVTAEAYRRAGGLPVVHCLEDMAFTDALERLGARIRQSPAVNVLTSLRVSGRVDVGLSWTLSKWTRAAAQGEPLMLESPDAIAQEMLNARYLRHVWQQGYSRQTVAQAAKKLRVNRRWLNARWKATRHVGELCQAVRWRHRHTRTGPCALPLMEAKAAIVELRARLLRHRAELRRPTFTPAQTGPAGTFPPVALSGAGWSFPPLPPETRREPDLRSADSLVPAASSEPAAGFHLSPVG